MGRPRGVGPGIRLFSIVANDSDAEGTLPPGIRLVGYRELAAVVGDVPLDRHGPQPPDIEAHRSVVAALFAHRSVVPAPAGVVFRRVDTLRNWLELHYAPLTEAVRFVEGRGEARLHIRCATPSSEGRGGRSQSTQKSSRLEALAFEIFHEVGDFAVAWALVPHVAQRSRDADDVSASFLVERSHWREFADAVAAAARRASGLDVALSGPWPPYDFVRLEFGG